MSGFHGVPRRGLNTPERSGQNDDQLGEIGNEADCEWLNIYRKAVPLYSLREAPASHHSMHARTHVCVYFYETKILFTWQLPQEELNVM